MRLYLWTHGVVIAVERSTGDQYCDVWEAVTLGQTNAYGHDSDLQAAIWDALQASQLSNRLIHLVNQAIVTAASARVYDVVCQWMAKEFRVLLEDSDVRVSVPMHWAADKAEALNAANIALSAVHNSGQRLLLAG